MKLLLGKYTDHTFYIGLDANVKLSGFEDGYLIGEGVLPCDLSSKDHERTESFVEFLHDFDLVVANTWCNFGESTHRNWKKDAVESGESQCDFILVSASVHLEEACIAKELSFNSDHWPVYASTCHFARGPPEHSRVHTHAARRRLDMDWKPGWSFKETILTQPPLHGNLEAAIQDWVAAAIDHAEVHYGPHPESQVEHLLRLKNAADSIEAKRKFNKAIWRCRRRAKRAKGRLMLEEACRKGRAPTLPNESKSKHVNRSKLFWQRS